MCPPAGSGVNDVASSWRTGIKVATAIFALVVPAAPALAQPLTCFPPPIDTCGKGVVRGATEGVEWTAWWIESNFEWRRVHWYRLLDAPARLAEPGASAPTRPSGAVSAASAVNDRMRSCNEAPHKEALAACRAMILASNRTLPPAILYNVERANRRDDTRPGYRRSAVGALVADGQRHRAGAWCECWRGAVNTTQYCLVSCNGGRPSAEGENMTGSFDLDAYLDRVQWGGAIRQDLDTLTGLLRAHMRRIPFENLDVLLGRPVRLDLEGIQDKLVRASRGGYCFEHATLFAAALEQLGFKPIRHTGRVVVVVPRAAAPRTHMFLTVPLAEGTFVVDPGFGALAPRVPVPLADGIPARIDDEAHWMARDGRYWVLHAQVGAKSVEAWASTAEEEYPVDFEMGNHFTSTHPKSPFVNRVMMRAITDDGRVTVMNRDVTFWRGNTAESTQIADRAALGALLVEHFGFDLPEVARLRVPSIPEWA